MTSINITKQTFCDHCDKTTVHNKYPCPVYSFSFNHGKKIQLCEDCFIELYLGCKRAIEKDCLELKVAEMEVIDSE